MRKKITSQPFVKLFQAYLKKKRKYITGMYQNRIKNNKKKLQTWMLNLSSKHKCNTLLSYSIQYENI
jgi:hypothetical protein